MSTQTIRHFYVVLRDQVTENVPKGHVCEHLAFSTKDLDEAVAKASDWTVGLADGEHPVYGLVEAVLIEFIDGNKVELDWRTIAGQVDAVEAPTTNPLPIQTRCLILQQKYTDFLHHTCDLDVEVVVSRSEHRGMFLAISGDEAAVIQSFEELSLEPTEKLLDILLPHEPTTVTYYYNVVV